VNKFKNGNASTPPFGEGLGRLFLIGMQLEHQTLEK
jgi:hypothetical protein